LLLQPHYAIERMSAVRRIIATNSFATLVTSAGDGAIASHVPALLDPEHDSGRDAEELVLIAHTARADPVSVELERGAEALLVFMGSHGYISPLWYGERVALPTWNFSTVHVSGIPEVLDGSEAFAVLEQTIEHFESAQKPRWRLTDESLEYAHRLAPLTVPFRLRPRRVLAKAKLSQDKATQIRSSVIDALERPGAYANPGLAREMRRALRMPL
jgi:transcriptional regulator